MEDARVAEVMSVYAELAEAASCGRPPHCPEFCGECCKNPRVEATVLECLPLAYELLRNGRAEEVLDRLEKIDEDTPCIFYRETPESGGHCGVYSYRALVCRLFGASVFVDKKGRRLPILCKTMKALPEAASASPELLPVGSDYAFRIENIDPDYGTRKYQINVAVRKALQTAGIRNYYEGIGDHC